MLELDATHFYFDSTFWLIVGIILIILDVFLGTLFILPLGISACVLAILLELEFRTIYIFFDRPFFTNWKDVLFVYSIFSVISIFLVKFLFQKTADDTKDINDY